MTWPNYCSYKKKSLTQVKSRNEERQRTSFLADNLHRILCRDLKINFVFPRILFPGLFFILFTPGRSSSQNFTNNNFGISAGCVISTGTHVNQIGVFIRTYVKYDRFQWNNDIRMNYYFRYLGPKIPFPEFQVSSGVLIGYGKQNAGENLFWGKTSNQTGFRNAIAYAYNAYFNTIKTSQQTGTISFQWNHFYLASENDLFARPILDRFRTAALQFAYQKENWKISLTHAMWTGRLGKAVKDSCYRSPAGYLDTCKCTFGCFSNGLLYVSGEFVEREFQQQLRASAGVDAEQIRHAVQNVIIHDAPFIPKKLRTSTNFHFPMIDDKGQQYLFRPGQKIRKPRLYFNLFANPDLIY
jgi:hypothetical protein